MMQDRIQVAVVLGTRPEVIKLAPVIRALEASGRARPWVVSTGQHREILEDGLAMFGIVPDVDLRVMETDQTPTAVAARVLSAIEDVLAARRPDWVVVQGDTTTVLAAALAAAYACIPIAHVEAGLRSHDLSQPFPEELNRVQVSHLASLHLAPTSRARDNLVREGIAARRVVVTGNTVVDALMAVVAAGWAPKPPHPLARIPVDRRWVLATAHRRESIGSGLEGICGALGTLAERSDVEVVFPVHPNPQVRCAVERHLGARRHVTLLSPPDYKGMVWLQQQSALILTDSGGIQEEAPSLGKPVLVLRDKTERPEAIEAGIARLVGTDPGSIVEATTTLLDNPAAYASMVGKANPFGDGHAAERVVEAILGFVT